MADTLTKEEEREYRTIFNMFDKSKSGNIPAEQLASCMRLARQNPTNRDIQQILTDLDKDSMEATIDFDEFCSIMKQYSKSRGDMEDLLLNSFRTFDKLQSGFVLKEELRRVLLTLGDVLEEKEFEELCKEAAPDAEGRINYEIFARLLLA